MIDAKVQGLSGLLAAIVGAAGFAADWPVVVAGGFFALAGGYCANAVKPVQQGQRLGFLMVGVVALFSGFLAGLLHPMIFHFTTKLVSVGPTLPLVMALGGVCGRPLLGWLANGGWTTLLDRYTGRAAK